MTHAPSLAEAAGEVPSKLMGGLAQIANAPEATRAALARGEVEPGDNLHTSYLNYPPPRTAVVADGTLVLVEAVASSLSEVPRLEEELRQLNAQITGRFGKMLSCFVPLNSLSRAEKLGGLASMRPSLAGSSVGKVTSEGFNAHRVGEAKAQFLSQLTLDGSNQVVGVISDSYNRRAGADADLISGEFPNRPVVVKELSPAFSGSDEGRAMLQIVADLAPGADLVFHTGFEGEAAMAEAYLKLAGCPTGSPSSCQTPTTTGFKPATVLVDDVFYLQAPIFADGVITQAINTINAARIPVFTAALNLGNNSIEGTFRPGSTLAPGSLFSGFRGGVAHDWDPGSQTDIYLSMRATPGSIFSLQWEDLYASIHPKGAEGDLDFYIFNETETGARGRLLGGTGDAELGKDPVVILQLNLANPFQIVLVQVTRPSSLPPGKEVYFRFTSSRTIEQREYSASYRHRTGFGHSQAEGAISVAAASYLRTPAFGVSPPEGRSYSSIGGTPILFDNSGGRKVETRERPDITAADGVVTTFFPSTTQNRFSGTSAAAPHAAAIAALMKQLVPGATSDLIRAAMRSSAIDMDNQYTAGFDNGYDYHTGAGFLDVPNALLRLQDPNAPLPLVPVSVPTPQLIPSPPPSPAQLPTPIVPSAPGQLCQLCNFRGTCPGGQCSCNLPFTGPDCTDCVAGFSGPNCIGVGPTPVVTGSAAPFPFLAATVSPVSTLTAESSDSDVTLIAIISTAVVLGLCSLLLCSAAAVAFLVFSRSGSKSSSLDRSVEIRDPEAGVVAVVEEPIEGLPRRI